MLKTERGKVNLGLVGDNARTSGETLVDMDERSSVLRLVRGVAEGWNGCAPAAKTVFQLYLT